jgi:hypothetical protein
VDHFLYYGLRIVHILAMAVWFAAPLLITSDVRRSLALGRDHVGPMVTRVDRAVTVSMGFGVLTIVTGVVLIFQLGGFKAVHPRIHTSLLLGLVALAVELMALKPAISGLSAADAKPGKIGMLAGIGHLLKVVILILMVLRIEQLPRG